MEEKMFTQLARTALIISMATSTLVIAARAQAEPIMCKNPKTYVCEVTGCVSDLLGKTGEDVVILDMAAKLLTVCRGDTGKCLKSTVKIEKGTNGYFIAGPATALRLIDDKLTMAITTNLRIVTQFFQCAKP